jgi:hypothetical protein
LESFSRFNPASVPETLRRAVFDFDAGKTTFVSCVEHGPDNGSSAMG